MAVATRPPVGALLREWRLRRRLSQFELALQAGVSSRHVSFVETGRARPSAEMVLHLSQELDVPLRDRNYLLLAAGYAPAFAQRELDAPEMGPVREAIDQVLAGHDPSRRSSSTAIGARLRAHGLTERRRSRTYPAVGYTTSRVLKTRWATGPMPLRGARYKLP